MNYENEFYANEHAMASDRYLNAIGDDFEAIGENFNAGGNGFGSEYNMASQGAGGSKAASLPYILVIANGNTSNETDVPIFYANRYAGAITDLPSGVTFTVTNFDSYQAFLYQTMSKKFLCGRTYWTSSSSTQVTGMTFTVINRDADGQSHNTPIVPVLDKYANQNTVNDNDTPYIIDGNTEVRLSTLYASTTITIHFYPAETVNDKKELSGKNSTTSYGNPYNMGMIVK